MKTTLIKVDILDDILTIRDRIAWSNSQRILLIVPRKKKNFPDEQGLVLLNRAARANGAQLGLVTGQSDLREFAKKIGVSYFHSITQAEREMWQDKGSTALVSPGFDVDSLLAMRKSISGESKNIPITRISKPVLISVLTAALLIFILILLPSATVVIYPETRMQEQVLEVHAATNIGQNNLTGRIPAWKKTFTLTGEMSAMSSGTVEVGKSRASGEVVVTNLTAQAVNLPMGTIFTTAPPEQEKFSSTRAVNIPGGGSSVVIPVDAVDAGESGNVGVGKIVLLEGIAGSSIYVTNEIAMTGGSSISLPAPSEEDYDRLNLKIIDELKGKALQQSIFASDEDQKPIMESLVLEEIIGINRQSPVGEAADILTLSITARFSVLYYNKTELADLLNQVLDVSLPNGFQAAETGLTIENAGTPEIIGPNEVVWKVQAERPVYENYSQQDLRRMVNGKTVDRAIKLINGEIPQYKSAEVDSFIRWWPYIPLLINKINFEERFLDGR